MSKVDDWSTGSRLLSFGWLIAWIVLGTVLLSVLSWITGAIYLGLFVTQYVTCRYLVCTRCHYYGRKCYMLGGDCAKVLFNKREPGPRMPDDALVGVWWAIITLFPIPFLILSNAWMFLITYLFISLGWHTMHHFIGCRRCKNTWCPLNPEKTAVTAQ